jgi:hypothetical protein
MQYTTIKGIKITLPDDKASKAFWRKAKRVADDESLCRKDLLSVVYSEDNPACDAEGNVTPETATAPLYRALRDLLFRLRIEESGQELEEIRAEYTVSVSEAADDLDISTQAVTKAISVGSLDAWKKGRNLYIHPLGLKTYKLRRSSAKRSAA